MTSKTTREDLDRDAQRGCERYHYLSDRHPERYRGEDGGNGAREDEKEEPDGSANTIGEAGEVPVVRSVGEEDTGRI